MLWRGITPRRAFWRGWLFGSGMFGFGLYWIHISMTAYGGVNIYPAIALTALLVAFLSIYPAILGWFVVRSFPQCNRVRLLLVSPAIWTLLEWVRSWFLSGFPWLSIGYSQIDSPLAGLAPLSGVYGVSWAAAFTSSLLVYAYLGGKQRALRHALPAFIALWGLGWILAQVNWSKPVEDPIDVAVVQGSIAQELKWEENKAVEIMERYLTLSQNHRDADLIVWPETAIPPFRDQAGLFLQLLETEMSLYNTDYLVGIREYDKETQQYFNSVINITNGPDRSYRKNHLVPFGEYTPLRGLLGNFMQFLNLPMMEDFSPGGKQQEPLIAAGQAMGVTICYEDAFPSEVRRALPYATILVNVSNDAWFGDSIAAQQHLQIARMRALENGRYLIRATNTGISAVIDDKGKIIAQTEQFAVNVLRARVQPMEAGTPYALAGNFQLFFIMFLCLIAGIVLHYFWHPPE